MPSLQPLFGSLITRKPQWTSLWMGDRN